MSRKAEQIKARYDKGYVTLEQLERYKELGVITEEEFNIIAGINESNVMVDEV